MSGTQSSAEAIPVAGVEVEFGPAAREELARIAGRYPFKQAAILPALWLAEREFGNITLPVIACIARALDLPPAKVHGLHTFYTLLRRATDGRHVIHVCSTLPCALRGSESLFDHIAKRLGIREGETTPDGLITLRKAECIAACDRAPCLQIDLAYHGPLTPAAADALIDELYRQDGKAK